MTSKLKSFHYTCYTHRRTHFDDEALRPGESREPDCWTEFRGVIVVPADPDWKATEQSEPDWDEGCYLMERKTLRRVPGWNFAGRPPDFLIQAFRENRMIDGVIIACSGKQTRREP